MKELEWERRKSKKRKDKRGKSFYEASFIRKRVRNKERK
jgi:hypothetical protein